MAPTNRINYHLDDDHPGGVAVNFTHEWIWRNSDLSNKYTQNYRAGRISWDIGGHAIGSPNFIGPVRSKTFFFKSTFY